jgi:putative transcriptional regulator
MAIPEPPFTSIVVRPCGSFRSEGATLVSKESTIALPADANDPKDFGVSVAGLERAQMGRRIRMLRTSLGLSQVEFAERYGIPVANIRQYEIGRTMPPPAVQSFLTVIAAEPERTAAALAA